MSKYTPEPWARHGHLVYFPDVMGGFSLRDCPNPEATARRIVACVNACRGLDTSNLETKGLASADQLFELEQQRNELLKAIDQVLNGTLLDSAGNRDEDGMMSAWADASNINRWVKILSDAVGRNNSNAHQEHDGFLTKE